jgi:hypothetical protein
MRGRILEPVERLSEIIFGLIMVLTITGAVSVTSTDRAEIRTMIIAALGCNIAWGIIDAGIYLMAQLGERGRLAVMAKSVRETAEPEKARSIIADELPEPVAAVLQPAQYDLIREKLVQSPSAVTARLTKADWLGALAVCILVILITFPVVIPFIFMQDVRLALRVSNVVAVALLFVCGVLFARHAGLWPWTTGLVMVGVGVTLVSIAIALGG